ncbi:small integral membrane protein 14-like [Amphibalanus amphitrite]|uniref:small integral membrane protein 14-like n=1 Tax=Amphibalanus amphitrite TaxID=1232801 RepID=UPI001C909E2E|nr:small integral membrane protein 14-like [Amphibalanus amphitrite]XP_043189381.1 small integral membrane protein 14-like [Amphibalanus amphitrite]XP_043223157.1 small integral membrane protein 14-like [Amphibalanus amphitrite]XP_043223158.1 small integral membrane protein 14-like [Amphibalanus amphitrite]XP_043223160.1 small integral membrane protein 14-like [Amphibalanus amphitrite]XP_043223161.1 small integral membrane protein 14-like [Amphibalanus amphitrite]XP_043223162.1 small integral
MADGYDPCACIWDHGMAMRRLISLLRGMQGFCTDSECFGELPGPQADASGGGNDLFLMAMVWVVLGVLLYLFRPSSLRNRGDTKPARLDQGGPGNNPPPTAN